MSNTTGIARSLTTRLNRKKSVTSGSGNGGLSRAFSLRKPESQPPRPEISLPIALVSATNPLAFDAPDIPKNEPVPSVSPVAKQLTAVSSSNSLRSEGSMPALSSAASTTMTFSGISTPTEEMPEHSAQELQNRLTSLPEGVTEIPSSPQSQKSYSSNKAKSPIAETQAPAIPKRAPSHTKRTHQVLARARSMSRVRPETSMTTGSTTSAATEESNRQSTSSSKDPVIARSSADMFSARTHTGSGTIDADHPFGAELAKLTEVAEEFSPRREKAEELPRSRARSSDGSERSSSSRPPMPPTPKAVTPMRTMRKQKPTIEPTVWNEEQEYLNRHGLRTFSAEEYMAEIGSPYSGSFPESVY